MAGIAASKIIVKKKDALIWRSMDLLPCRYEFANMRFRMVRSRLKTIQTTKMSLDYMHKGMYIYMYMPTVLRVLNLLYVIHTRDHGYPHVTVFLGTPEGYEAKAKIRLDLEDPALLEPTEFSEKAVKRMFEVVKQNRIEWLEVWNVTRPG